MEGCICSSKAHLNLGLQIKIHFVIILSSVVSFVVINHFIAWSIKHKKTVKIGLGNISMLYQFHDIRLDIILDFGHQPTLQYHHNNDIDLFGLSFISDGDIDN